MFGTPEEVIAKLRRYDTLGVDHFTYYASLGLGPKEQKRLMGRRMGAEEAARYGLVNKVVPKHELMPTARAWAGRLAEAAPLALQTVKEVLRAIECRPLADAFRIMRTGDLPTYRAMLGSEDAAEGVRAFVEKRKPALPRRCAIAWWMAAPAWRQAAASRSSRRNVTAGWSRS